MIPVEYCINRHMFLFDVFVMKMQFLINVIQAPVQL